MALINKTKQAHRIGSKALATFENAHTSLLRAAELADEHADEHDAHIDELAARSSEARKLADSHRRRANKIAEILGYDDEPTDVEE